MCGSPLCVRAQGENGGSGKKQQDYSFADLFKAVGAGPSLVLQLKP